MREQFANEVVMKLAGKVSDEELRAIHDTILSVLANYEIAERETALTLYESYVPKFYDVYLAYLKINGRSTGTLKTYNYHLVSFFLHLRRPVNELTAADIYEYLCYLGQKGTVSNRTLDHVRIIINGFLEWAYDEDYISKNPCHTVKPIRFTEKQRQPLTDIELEMVRAACRNTREAAITETMYSTGCRVSELVALKVTDVDLTNRTVTLFGKGSKYRTSFINARAELMLRKYLSEREDNCPALIVTDRKPARPLQKGAYEKMIRELGERAGLGRRLTPHIFRHTFATNLVKRGARVEDVQRLLGHEKISTTMIYTKVDTSDIRRDHERFIV